ncbi:MAG: hypothetical protein IPI90_10585 [Saprospiraceae bacterium]|nr:hypothetical protein [Candidatus Vicinibacter affinis]
MKSLNSKGEASDELASLKAISDSGIASKEWIWPVDMLRRLLKLKRLQRPGNSRYHLYGGLDQMKVRRIVFIVAKIQKSI